MTSSNNRHRLLDHFKDGDDGKVTMSAQNLSLPTVNVGVATVKVGMPKVVQFTPVAP